MPRNRNNERPRFQGGSFSTEVTGRLSDEIQRTEEQSLTPPLSVVLSVAGLGTYLRGIEKKAGEFGIPMKRLRQEIVLVSAIDAAPVLNARVKREQKRQDDLNEYYWGESAVQIVSDNLINYIDIVTGGVQ